MVLCLVPGIMGLSRIGTDADQSWPGRPGNQILQEIVAEDGLRVAVDVAGSENSFVSNAMWMQVHEET